MRNREAYSLGKKEELEIWTHDLIVAISRLAMSSYLPVSPVLERTFHVTSSSCRISLSNHLLYAMSLLIWFRSFFLGRCYGALCDSK